MSIVLVALTSSNSTAQAQSGRARFDTGIVTLGPNQVLRLTISGGDVNGDGNIRVRFRRLGYIEQNNIYRVASQTTTNPIRLASNEAASFDISPGEFNAVRGIVMGNLIGTDAADAPVTVQIIDTTTGEVNSVLIAWLIP